MPLAFLLHVDATYSSQVFLPSVTTLAPLLDVSEWLDSIAKPSGYINVARYTHYFTELSGKEYCIYYEPRNLVERVNSTIAHLLDHESNLYPWYGNLLVVGVHTGAVRTIQMAEWPSIAASMKRYAQTHVETATL